MWAGVPLVVGPLDGTVVGCLLALVVVTLVELYGTDGDSKKLMT